MQYFKPEGALFVGDCMPFVHEGVFHLFYLLDENHHQGRNGVGGHQCAHASTTDLLHWQHHPLALSNEEECEGSICPGSVFWHAGAFHAFYATRKPDWSQHLSHASSADGVTFVKTRPLTVLPVPSEYDPLHCGGFQSHYALAFEPGLGLVTLAEQSCTGVTELSQPFGLEVVCRGDIIDVCIGNTRCIINRLPQERGDCLFWFCEGGEVSFKDICIRV